jgi:hypothetical protein
MFRRMNIGWFLEIYMAIPPINALLRSERNCEADA